jgi:hypothetical protein
MARAIIFSAIAIVTAFVASCVILAAPGTEASATASTAKSQILDIRPSTPVCSEQAWPYYQSKCIRDDRRPMGKAIAVRIVAADRLN